MASLTVSVVSADHEVWSGEADEVIARTTEGEIGILAGHQPLLALLAGDGEVRVNPLDGGKIKVEAEDGFLSVDHNVVTIVAGKANLSK